MPIYEMEPPPGTIRFVIPYPGETPAPRGFRAWLKRVPTPEEAARSYHATGTVLGWLAVIFFVWLAQTYWADLPHIFTAKTIAVIALLTFAALL